MFLLRGVVAVFFYETRRQKSKRRSYKHNNEDIKDGDS